MLEYTGRLHQHFASRMKSFNQLKRKIEQYQYHLKEHEICERKLVEAGEMSTNGSGLFSDNFEIKCQNVNF